MRGEERFSAPQKSLDLDHALERRQYQTPEPAFSNDRKIRPFDVHGRVFS
jgi:hypothetical protein